MIIDGTKIAGEIYENLKTEVSTLTTKPKLSVILVGDNASSMRYINQKEKQAQIVGMGFELNKFESTITEDNLLEEIEKINSDTTVSGLIIQLPLPDHINTKKVINAISPKKDVDGFHPENLGKIIIGDDSGFASCTPAGIMHILNNFGEGVEGKIITVIGRSNIVGKPVINMLINAGATVLCCNSKTPDLTSFTRQADIVICAAGKPGLLQIDMIKMGIVVIDVGFTVIEGKIYGDADFNMIEQHGNHITPVPGGVGPLTVAMLLTNTLKAYKNK